MTRIFYIIAGLTCFLLLSSCEKEESYPPVPAIENRGYNTNTINVVKDTGDWIWSFTFVDGNGNIGTQAVDTAIRVFVINLVTGDTIKLPFPAIPANARGGKKYVKGSGTVRLRKNAFFHPRAFPVDRTKDTFRYEMYIIDDSKFESNRITTDAIYVSKEL